MVLASSLPGAMPSLNITLFRFLTPFWPSELEEFEELPSVFFSTPTGTITLGGGAPGEEAT